MRILALDQNSTTGYAHSSGVRGTWKLKSEKGQHAGYRCLQLLNLITDFVGEHATTVIAYEQAFMGRQARGGHLRIQLVGAILIAGAYHEIDAHGYNAMTVKKWLTGDGRADKQAVIDTVRSRFGIETESDHIADAVAILKLAEQLEVSF